MTNTPGQDNSEMDFTGPGGVENTTLKTTDAIGFSENTNAATMTPAQLNASGVQETDLSNWSYKQDGVDPITGGAIDTTLRNSNNQPTQGAAPGD